MSELSVRWKQLPEDLQRKILPYTYSPQPDILLKDIRNYHTTLNLIKEIYKNHCLCDCNWDKCEGGSGWLINDLQSWLNNYIPTMLGYMGKFITIIERNPYYHLRIPDVKFYIEKLDLHSPNTEVRIFWGLLTADERKHFICSRASLFWKSEWETINYL